MNQKWGNTGNEAIFGQLLDKESTEKMEQASSRDIEWRHVYSVTRSLGFMLNENDHLEDETGRR